MDKQKIIKAVISKISEELEVARAAVKSAREDATNEESKPENEYDTRALQSSYVAAGQSKRVVDLEEMLYEFKHLDLRKFTDKDRISATALVKVEHHGKNLLLFYMSKGGGHLVQVDGQNVQVVTPSSPLGEALLGQQVGDSVIVEIGTEEKEYEILSIE